MVSLDIESDESTYVVFSPSLASVRENELAEVSIESILISHTIL